MWWMCVIRRLSVPLIHPLPSQQSASSCFPHGESSQRRCIEIVVSHMVKVVSGDVLKWLFRLGSWCWWRIWLRWRNTIAVLTPFSGWNNGFGHLWPDHAWLNHQHFKNKIDCSSWFAISLGAYKTIWWHQVTSSPISTGSITPKRTSNPALIFSCQCSGTGIGLRGCFGLDH